ncbi:MAG: hypothetical protein ACI96W_003120, partial [Paraglaciecola sp.]
LLTVNVRNTIADHGDQYSTLGPGCNIFRQYNSTGAQLNTKKLRTLSDIAKIAGVSDSTVSRALSNNTLISENKNPANCR